MVVQLLVILSLGLLLLLCISSKRLNYLLHLVLAIFSIAFVIFLGLRLNFHYVVSIGAAFGICAESNILAFYGSIVSAVVSLFIYLFFVYDCLTSSTNSYKSPLTRLQNNNSIFSVLSPRIKTPPNLVGVNTLGEFARISNSDDEDLLPWPKTVRPLAIRFGRISDQSHQVDGGTISSSLQDFAISSKPATALPEFAISCQLPAPFTKISLSSLENLIQIRDLSRLLGPIKASTPSLDDWARLRELHTLIDIPYTSALDWAKISEILNQIELISPDLVDLGLKIVSL